jgi:hypothetical protein
MQDISEMAKIHENVAAVMECVLKNEKSLV